MARSVYTRTRLQKAVEWCDEVQATARWQGKKCRVIAWVGRGRAKEGISSGWRKSFLTAVDAVRVKAKKLLAT